MRMSLTERTQVLLSPQQRRKLEQLAARSSTSVGAVIRAAIDAYLPPVSTDRRHRALDELFSLDAPVADWTVMEAEIEAGYRS
jgi:predicted transcriptional regulator